MTREYAIKELELIAKVTMWNDRREAVEMAIEALKQEPIVRCWDCIHAEKMNKPWADGRQIVFCWKHGKERFTTGDGHCECGERAKE